MSDTTTQYVPRDYRRVCDQCGNLYNRSELHRKGPWIYCSSCDAHGERIREEEDAAIARQRPFRILPVPNAKPLVADEPYDYQAEEAQVFDLILQVAPARNIGGATSPLATAWAISYLCGIVSQGTRPSGWVTSARSKATSLYATLVNLQYGSTGGPAATVQDPRYGGFAEGTSQLAGTTIAAGIAFLKAYTVLGVADALAAANRCATWLRHSQCGDVQLTTWHTVYPSGGSPYHVGGFSATVLTSNGMQSGIYSVADGYGIVFLKALAAVVGASSVYGDAGSTSYFSAATSASLSTMISELAAFIETGPKDSAHGDANTPGLSVTAPKLAYTAFLSNSTGTGTWSGAPTGSSIAQAVAGLYANDPSDTLIPAVVSWLNSLTANAANATPSTNTPQQTLNALTGTYDPTVAPPTSLTTSAPFTEATGASYDLSALGLLSTVLASTNATQLKASRKTLSHAQQYSTFDLGSRYLGPIGRAGLSLQPNTSTGSIYTPDVVLAAQFGAIYRVAT